MSDPLAPGNGTIGGGGLTYTYTTFELTAEVGDGLIGAPDINISLTAQSAILRVGGGTIGAGLPTLAFDDYSAEVVTGTGTIGTGNTQLRDIVRALFPALSPSDRSFEPPEYAISKYKAINGAKSRRLWASQPGGGTLDLLFENIDDDDAESILATHDVARGAGNDVILPDEVLSGATGDLLTYMRSAGGQAWSFDTPPEVESVKQGMSTVRVKLSGRRKVQFNSVGSVGGTFAVGAAPVDEIDPGGYADCDYLGKPPDGEFLPLDLDPVAWWDFSDAGTVTIDSGAISAVTDKSGNGWTLSQATADRRPVRASAAINGLAVAEWPATDNPKSLNTATGSLLVKEVWVVLQFSGGSTFDSYEGIFASLNNSLSETIGGSIFNTSLQVVDLPAYLNNDDTNDISDDLLPEISTPCLLRFVVPGAGWATTSGVTVGMDRALNSFNRGWNGRIGEVIVFDASPSVANRASLRTYSFDKWGITP